MRPYYDDGTCTIYHGEALNILNALDHRFAVVIADPPYSSGGMFRSDRQAPPESKYRGWSHSPTETRPPASEVGDFSGDSRDQRAYGWWASIWLSQAWRLAGASAQVFVFTDWRQLPTTTDAVQAGGWVWRGLVVWDKGIGRPMRGRFRNHLEYVVWGSHGTMPDADGVYPSTLIRCPPPEQREHVTQKPETLIRHLLSVAPAGPVLDPFMGSGTTLRAAKDLGRSVVGIEIEERYCEIAARRLAQEVLDLAGAG
jgi:site-specific DNA-methyltransferase (adenine-specific)